MTLKLKHENNLDLPVLMCDVCGNRILDVWGDLVSGSRVNEGFGNVVIHHKTCPTTEPLHTTIVKFFNMLMIRHRMGDVGSDGVTDKMCLEMPVGEKLE